MNIKTDGKFGVDLYAGYVDIAHVSPRYGHIYD